MVDMGTKRGRPVEPRRTYDDDLRDVVRLRAVVSADTDHDPAWCASLVEVLTSAIGLYSQAPLRRVVQKSGP
jgi:hypothetical protein